MSLAVRSGNQIPDFVDTVVQPLKRHAGLQANYRFEIALNKNANGRLFSSLDESLPS